MTRDLKELLPSFKVKVEKLINTVKDRGIDIIITSTYRSFIEQDDLYSQGRTKPGKIITNAKGGQSSHNIRRAVDFCILKGKKASYTCTGDYYSVGNVATKMGLEWGGNWKFKDLCHIQDLFCDVCNKKHKISDFKETGKCKVKI